MGDPYYRFTGNVSRPNNPGYMSSEVPTLASHHADMQVASSDVRKRDKSQLQPGRYGVDDITNSVVYPESILGGELAGVTNRNQYPSSLGEPNLISQRWDAQVGGSSAAVHPEPNFAGVSAGAAIRGYPSAPGASSSVGHRPDAHDISPRVGVHPEPTLGSVSAAATIRGNPSGPEVANLVGQRWDAPAGISPSAGLQLEPHLGVVSSGASKSYASTIEDPDLVGQRQDGPPGVSPRIPDASYEKSASMRSPPDAAGESNILFVDGLPTDCTRREVGHLFRPFRGYKDIKVIHKEPRRSGDKAMVYCFVEFEASIFAMTAMQALQGYIFDDKKPKSPALKIQFAHFPFKFRADRDDE